MHSFLENFSTNTGFIGRKAFYGNQWARDKEGNWYELTNAKFTAELLLEKVKVDYAEVLKETSFTCRTADFLAIIHQWIRNTPVPLMEPLQQLILTH